MIERFRKSILRIACRIGPAANRGGLFCKYVFLFLAVVCVALVTNTSLEIWFFYEQHHADAARIQQEQAKAAAAKIGAFVRQVEDQLDWTAHQVWIDRPGSREQLELWRLALHRIPAVSDLALLDASGHEQLAISRFGLDRVSSQIDRSREAQFAEAAEWKVYRSPVYFRRESEPYMTIAVAGPRPDLGVRVAEVNLRFIWDAVSQIKVGERGQAYVVSERGRVIAHSDVGVVLRNSDFSRLEQVQAARAQTTTDSGYVPAATDIQGRQVLAAYAPIDPLGWTMVTELPLDEAQAPLYAAIAHSAGPLLFGLGLALLAGIFLARRMIAPIQTLREGAAQISHGRLDHRVVVKTGDEIEELADQFNQMAVRLQESYADLENKIERRTRELVVASQRLASQEALRATQSDLARISRLITMGEMAAAIAHEINQPLAGIVANASASLRWLAGTTPNLEEARAALKQIIDAGHHAANVIGSIRVMFRKGGQERVPVDINKLIREVVELVHGELERHGVSAQTELDERLPAITADRVQLQQVILNLLMNAIDAMDSIMDRPRLLHVKSEIQDSDAVLVSVADSGTGIDAKDVDRIFDSFFTTKYQGTGMGLAICRSVVEAHDGRLWVSAGVPTGSVFHFVLPTEAADKL